MGNKEYIVPPLSGPARPNTPSLDTHLSEEYQWLKQVKALMQQHSIEQGDDMSWAAFYATKQQSFIDDTTTIALMPLFLENAHTAAMMHHAMSYIKKVIDHLNPGQVLVMAVDQPLYALGKQIQ